MKKSSVFKSKVMLFLNKIRDFWRHPINFSVTPLKLLPILIALPIIVVGYGIITRNIKPNQSASAEQIAGSPESGVKSRISELYDVLVARNRGTDNNTMAGMDVLHDNWGAKWNRIKSAALVTPTPPAAGGVKSVQRGTYSNYPHSSQTDHTVYFNAVNPAKSSMRINGYCASGDNPSERNLPAYIKATSASSITVYCRSSQFHYYYANFDWEVIEYN